MLLTGMKIVSFCHFLQGPASTQYLADMGADVIKIEPAKGPFERSWSGAKVFVGGVSGFFLAGNRNKRSFSVDLKSPEGKELVLRLIDQADAVVENFRTGVMEKLGLSYDDLKKRKPDIIFASGTGWGLKGPMVGKTAQDLIIQARSGLIAATGPADRATAVGCAVVDQHGGALLAMGVLAAYVKKLKTGEGTHVQGSLLNSGLDLQTEPLTNYMSSRPGSGVFKRQENLVSWYHEAPCGVYRLKDAQIVMPTNDIPNVAEALDCDALRAVQHLDRYDHRDQLATIVAAELKNWTYDDLSKALDARGCWYGIVQDYEAVAADPQMIANDIFRKVEINGETATLVNHPLRYNGQVPDLHTLSTEVGSHTAEILTQMGIPAAEAERLFADGVVFGPQTANQQAAE